MLLAQDPTVQQSEHSDQPPNNEAPQRPDNIHIPRTGKYDLISSFHNKLYSRGKLSTNKEIEEKNKERELEILKNKQEDMVCDYWYTEK
jgi:hypothetical protein